MTRTEESLGGLVRRARISSADARLPSAKTAFMISRSRRVSRSKVVWGIVIQGTANATSVTEYSRHTSYVKPPSDHGSHRSVFRSSPFNRHLSRFLRHAQRSRRSVRLRVVGPKNPKH